LGRWQSGGKVRVDIGEIKDMSENKEDQETSAEPVDPAITPEIFLEWRSPRFGKSNPERMTNLVWNWLIKTKRDAFHANKQLNGPSPFSAGPCWCFYRFGQSSTNLPDGRKILIAGEHEDHYDPDFYIYNDVVVENPDGRIEIFAYPREVFPPTDFHSATLVGDRIVIIGNLGYPDNRKSGTTQVLILNLANFVISQVKTSGAMPGWIHEHTAVLSEAGNSIMLQGGKLDRGKQDKSLVDNIDDWRLYLTDWRWERLTERRWLRWVVLRSDGQRNHLWEIQQAHWFRKVGWNKELLTQTAQLEEQLGIRPDLDLLDNVFCPPISHQVVPQSETEYNVFRIIVNGIVVRYVVTSDAIQLTVEGDLTPAQVEAITTDLVKKLSALENTTFTLNLIQK
jgi:hypothetical protein